MAFEPRASLARRQRSYPASPGYQAGDSGKQQAAVGGIAFGQAGAADAGVFECSRALAGRSNHVLACASAGFKSRQPEL